MADYVITTAVGTGAKGFAGDSGPATAALLNGPFDVAFDRAGNLCFSDTFNHRIRRVDARSGVITTIAGNGEPGYSGDGGPAMRASLNEPYGIAIDRAGNIFVADRLNRRVRRIDAANGTITTLAGTGEPAYSGDGGPAARAPGLPSPMVSRSMPRSGISTSPMSPITASASSVSPRARSTPSPASARPSTAAMAPPHARPAFSAPGPSSSAPTAPSTSSSGRAVHCAPSMP